MMFFLRKKKKTRMEQAREDLEKQIRVVNKQAKETRKEFGKRLHRTAEDLRSNWLHGFSRDDQQRISNVAAELERVAQTMEDRAEKGFSDATETAKRNVWLSVFVAFAIGIFTGLIVKEILD